MNRLNTDIHTHLIPDVDDGAADLDSSIAAIQSCIQQGIYHFFCTPHSFAYIDPDESARSKKAFHLLKERIEKEGIEAKLYLGCELLCMERWMERLIEGLNTGQYPSMNGGPYILIEFTTFEISIDEVNYCVDSLLQEGWIPIFAHIERYYDTFASIAFIENMKEKGCLFQVSFNALEEECCKDIKDFARLILDLQLADFMGSDCHGIHHRPPEIEKGLHYIHSHCNKDYAQRLLIGNTKKYFLS